MTWGAYEIFAVLSGITLVGGGLFPRVAARERLWLILGGVMLIGYGIYVANQTYGTFRFPVMIFIIPFVGAGYVVFRALTHQSRSPEEARDSAAAPSPSHSAPLPAEHHRARTTDAVALRAPAAAPLAAAAGAVATCPTCQTHARPNAKFCVGCGAPLAAPPRCCPGCGAPLSVSARFCHLCGAPLSLET